MMAQRDDEVMVDSLQELFQDKGNLKKFLELMLEKGMEAEMSKYLGARRYERLPDRNGSRNGYKPRELNTRAGKLRFSVPQARGCEPYHPSMFARWQRSERALLVACAEMYFQGVSTRKVQAVLDEMCGLELSAATVSRVACELDEKLAEFRNYRLVQGYPYLIVDARYEKVRVNGHVVSQAVLAVAGVNEMGFREILDWRVGDSESESTWGELFPSLKDRGLQGVKLITSDCHRGIKAAMAKHFQGVQWQRCRVHFMREILGKVTWKDYQELSREVRGVFAPEERKECLARAEELARSWEKRKPGIAKMLREGFEDCLTVCALPPTHRGKLKSTNMVERFMRELKRRSRVIGVFPNVASCERLIGAELLELHESWQLENRYLDMSLLLLPEYQEALGPRLAKVG